MNTLIIITDDTEGTDDTDDIDDTGDPDGIKGT